MPNDNPIIRRIHDNDFKNHSDAHFELRELKTANQDLKIDPNEIYQTEDYSFNVLSVLRNLASRSPNVIKDMFVGDTDDTVTVRFYETDKDGKKQPVHVTVDKTLPDNLDSTSAPWVRYIEKAYIAGIHPSFKNKKNKIIDTSKNYTPDLKDAKYFFSSPDFVDHILEPKFAEKDPEPDLLIIPPKEFKENFRGFNKQEQENAAKKFFYHNLYTKLLNVLNHGNDLIYLSSTFHGASVENISIQTKQTKDTVPADYENIKLTVYDTDGHNEKTFTLKELIENSDLVGEFEQLHIYHMEEGKEPVRETLNLSALSKKLDDLKKDPAKATFDMIKAKTIQNFAKELIDTHNMPGDHQVSDDDLNVALSFMNSEYFENALYAALYKTNFYDPTDATQPVTNEDAIKNRITFCNTLEKYCEAGINTMISKSDKFKTYNNSIKTISTLLKKRTDVLTKEGKLDANAVEPSASRDYAHEYLTELGVLTKKLDKLNKKLRNDTKEYKLFREKLEKHSKKVIQNIANPEELSINQRAFQSLCNDYLNKYYTSYKENGKEFTPLTLNELSIVSSIGQLSKHYKPALHYKSFKLPDKNSKEGIQKRVALKCVNLLAKYEQLYMKDRTRNQKTALFDSKKQERQVKLLLSEDPELKNKLHFNRFIKSLNDGELIKCLEMSDKQLMNEFKKFRAKEKEAVAAKNKPKEVAAQASTTTPNGPASTQATNTAAQNGQPTNAQTNTTNTTAQNAQPTNATATTQPHPQPSFLR